MAYKLSGVCNLLTVITCCKIRLFGPARALARGPPFSPIHVKKQNFVLTDSESPVVIRKKANKTFESKNFYLPCLSSLMAHIIVAKSYRQRCPKRDSLSRIGKICGSYYEDTI